MTTKITAELRGLRAKAELYDELVEQLARTERALAQARATAASSAEDGAWRELANELAGALRPYTLFREQRVQDGRIVVETRVPGSTLRAARTALEHLAREVAAVSYRSDGLGPASDVERAA
jgi:hypothetical protein